MLFLVAVCWCREHIYIPTKCTFFQIMHRNRAQNIIQCHDNNIWKQVCIKKLSYSNETNLQYNLQREETGWKIHVRSISQIGPIATKKELDSQCTREWDRRGNLGLDHVLYYTIIASRYRNWCGVFIYYRFVHKQWPFSFHIYPKSIYK